MNTTKMIINMETGLARVRGNQNFYFKLLNMFLSSEQFTEFENVYNQGDFVHAGEVMHAIKGMAANLSLDLLTDSATELMNLLRLGNDDPQKVKEYRIILEDTINTIKETIK